MSENSWKILKTIPKIQDFQKSVGEMNSEQLDLNIVEISLLALNNENMMKWLINSMANYEFYLKYRYVLPNILNGKLSATIQNGRNFAIAKFDEKFVNGQDLEESSEKQMKKPFKKVKRLNFSFQKQQIISKLNSLSQQIFKIENVEEKTNFLQVKLAEINSILSKKEQQLSEGSQSQQNEPIKNIYIFSLGKPKKISQIIIKNSYFIKTKNRHPLVLDFGFAKFLYKNDDQLAHEIIAFELLKYINAILGKEYILPYEIIPEKQGAFYQFIQDSQTIHYIKGTNEGSLKAYFDTLCDKHSTQAILTRFAESYSGFCIFQYLLDIKDRNNANIMIKEDGSIFHIDLTFIFGSGPGGLSFESAPFKMTKEYVKILGGFQSDYFKKFETLLVQHMTKIYECQQELIWKLNILSRRDKQIKCFQKFSLKDFVKKIPNKLEKVKPLIQDLIDSSYDSMKTNKYDLFQFKSNDILQ